MILLVIIFDPACYYDGTPDNYHAGWDINTNNHDEWKRRYNAMTLYSTLNSRQDFFPISKIHKIVFMNDIDMEDVIYIDRVNFYIQTTTDTSTGGDYNNIKIRHNKLDIDGNNHYLSMGINDLALTGHQFYGPEDPKYVYKEDWTLENIDTYGSSYWGGYQL